jgi:transposase-like protein
MSSSLSRPEFHSEEAAFAYVEARIWPEGPVCPHCGGVERVGKLQGKSTRVGVWKCYQCRKPFTVKIGTIFEDSKVAMHIWLQAMYLIAGSKKGISSNQLHRTLGVTLKTAWFMSHRIREAMASGDLSPFGESGPVEMDETFIGREPGVTMGKGGTRHRMKVVTLVDRTTGRARSMVVDKLNVATVTEIAKANIIDQARLMTDEAGFYVHMNKHYEHGFTAHSSGQYVRGDIHTNTVEGYFSIFKRGMKGVYQHCAKHHLHRYLAEFDFRYSNRVALGYNDADRSDILLMGVVGKRLTYAQSSARA